MNDGRVRENKRSSYSGPDYVGPYRFAKTWNAVLVTLTCSKFSNLKQLLYYVLGFSGSRIHSN